MLREVLQAVEEADGPITLNELSRRLQLDAGVIEAMLEHWARKGKINVDRDSGAACARMPVTCSCGSNPGGGDCPFMARLPRGIPVVRQADIRDNTQL